MGAGEDLANNAASVAENPVNQATPTTENPISNQAGGAENPVNVAKDQAVGAENPVNDTLGGSDVLVNDKAHAAENSINDTAGDDGKESAMKDKAGEDDKQGAAENLAEEKPDAIETPVSSKADRLPEEAKEILISLAGKWEDVLDANALQVIPLKGAMTNEVFEIKWPATTEKTSRKVLVRIYGEGVEIFFDRDDEIRTFEYMSKNGQGPRLLGRFTNGRVEEFIHARVISHFLFLILVL